MREHTFLGLVALGIAIVGFPLAYITSKPLPPLDEPNSFYVVYNGNTVDVHHTTMEKLRLENGQLITESVLDAIIQANLKSMKDKS